MMARGDAGFGSRNVPGLIPDLPAVGHQEKPGCATPRLESRLFRPPWSLDIFGPPLAFLCRKLRRKLCQQKGPRTSAALQAAKPRGGTSPSPLGRNTAASHNSGLRPKQAGAVWFGNAGAVIFTSSPDCDMP